ncbi:MAG: PEPxxWA-CTERM sorting domain-containing protein [Pseudomonadota bacterium]
MKKRLLNIWAATFGVMLLSAGSANAQTVVNFETETAGAKPNGYSTGGIIFNDTMGANLSVGNFGGQGIGTRSLAIGSDDASGLEMLFGGTSSNLSLIFGNDDPCCSAAGDLALLRIFTGTTQVGQTSVLLNRDDLANQTIGISGVNFNRATFVYTNAAFNPIGLLEIVDNITYTPAVPEPATWGLMILGFGAVGGVLRRKRETSVRLAAV